MTDKQLMIIEKAKEVLLEKGLFESVMDDIAEAVGLTRRTLYRHFETKEDIAYQAMMLIMKEWNAYSEQVFRGLSGVGIERLETFLGKLIDYMENRRNVMKFLGEFDFYVKDQGMTSFVHVPVDDFNKTIQESDNLISHLIEMGVKDGSIHSSINVNLMEATISNVLWSFGQRIAIRSNTIKNETGIEAIVLMRNQVAMYIMALKEA